MAAAKPLVSIVTPTLNRRALLEWTVRSVRRQTYDHFEHIVVDGGSDDGTLEMLKSNEQTYPLRWVSEPDGGMYPAINKGLRLARGEILAYLNSDDLYFPWTLETVVRAFQAHPAADFVFGDVLNVDDATGTTEFYWMPPFHLDFIRRDGFLAQPGVFWRRRTFEAEGAFDETLRYVADCDYWMRAGGRREFRKVNEFVAIERDHHQTLRASAERALNAELRDVRSRYVSLEGRRHEILLRRYQLRKRMWARVYWSIYLLESLLPRVLRRGPWSRFLNEGRTQISRTDALVMLIPRVGRRFWARAVHPSRYWLEPDG